jgi:hypothetical protein
MHLNLKLNRASGVSRLILLYLLFKIGQMIVRVFFESVDFFVGINFLMHNSRIISSPRYLVLHDVYLRLSYDTGNP